MDLKTKAAMPVLHRLIRGMTNAKYHSVAGTWSSSQLKTVLESETLFIKKYITKEIDREEREAFDTGTYFHTTVLEPHKVDEEIAVFPGKVRFGKVWEEFKAKAAKSGQIPITKKQKEQGDTMAKAVRASPVSMGYLEGIPEISLFVEIVIAHSQIYAPHFSKVLGRDGWQHCEAVPTSGFRMIIKVRADNLGKEFISDLKSTSIDAQSRSVENAIEKYEYDLSAALYIDMFSLLRPAVKDFVWIFASKETHNAAAWKAVPDQLLIGRAKYMHALKRIADLSLANWEISDYLREARPAPHQYSWLRQKETELL